MIGVGSFGKSVYKTGSSSASATTKRNLKMKSTSLGGMVSAMIPGAKVDTKGRIMVNVGTSKETLAFNIGGMTFETYRSTLFRLPNSPLANDKFLKDHYRPEKKDYFFDRDPDIFRATLNYLRTGELHIPSYICGPAAKTELEFWGVLPNKIERCCWTNYNDWNSTLEALNQLEHDRKGAMPSTEVNPNKKQAGWNRYQSPIWNFFNNPDSSFGAKIYGFISLFFVILSIFSFIASTTTGFQFYRYVTEPKSAANQSTTVLYDNTSSVYSTSTYNTTTDLDSADVTKIAVKHPILHIIDISCLAFFTVEYIIRVVFALKRIKFMTSFMGVIDLIAILPDYIEMIVCAAQPELMYHVSAMNFVTVFRIVRVLRIFRLIKHVPGLWILVYTLKASVGELVLLVCFMSVGILIFSSLIYFVEERDNFESIPHAFWWALITMTTVGYGDMYPVTVLGKLVGSLCAMSGLLMIGFSVPALVNNFMLYYKHVQFALQAEKEALCKEDDNTDVNSSGTNGSSLDILETPKSGTNCKHFEKTISDKNGNTSSETIPLVSLVMDELDGDNTHKAIPLTSVVIDELYGDNTA